MQHAKYPSAAANNVLHIVRDACLDCMNFCICTLKARNNATEVEKPIVFQ